MYWALAVVLLHTAGIPQTLTTPASQAVADVSATQAPPRPVIETVSAPIPEPSWKEPGTDSAAAPAADVAPAALSSSRGLRELPQPAGRSSAFFAAERTRTPKLWYALVAAGHGAATFDAWATRRVIQSGRGHELNPLLKPFANSNALYAAVQVGPALFDFLGRRMMRSEKPWVRRMWWLPQTLGTAASFWSGAHNLALARR